LAIQYDKLIDVHCDETDDVQARFLEILQPDWKIIKRISDRAMVFMLLNEEEEWGKLERRTKNKYKQLIKEISPIDLTDLMKSTLKANEKQLQKQIEFWQREFRFWK
ncbi:hypothetical protein ACQKKJ_16830, partial [Staphylococcus cohnii]